MISVKARKGKCALQMLVRSTHLNLQAVFVCVWELLFFVGELLSCIQLVCVPKDYSPPVFPAPVILQGRIVEWVAISFFKGRRRMSNLHFLH